MQAGTRVEVGGSVENQPEGLLTLGVDGTATELGGDEISAYSTIYFVPDAKAKYSHGSTLKPAEIASLPRGTKMLVGYNVGGPVSARLPVFNICSVKWNRPDNFYMDPSGKLIPGDQMDERNIKPGAMVFYRQ